MKKSSTFSLKWAFLLFFSGYIFSIFTPLNAQISFTKSNLDFNGFGPAPTITSLMYGPDGRLYVLDYPGTIYAFTIQRNGSDDYVVIAKETITGVKDIANHDDDGTLCSGGSSSCNNRESTGLTVVGTAANPILYVTSSDFRIGAGFGGGSGDVNLDTNSGVITRLTWNGDTWDAVDMVRGLPRSEENHATNGLEFTTINGTDYLIVAQGGNANGGAPSINFTLICEYALSAAVLAVNLTTLESMPIFDDNGRSYIYDLPTLDDPTRANANGITDPNAAGYNGVDVNDPFGGNDGLNQAIVVPGGPVQIFSPGYRNAYDLVVTESGSVYVTDNGANASWGGVPVNEGGGSVTNDYDSNETGGTAGTATADGEFMNNEDHLQLITTNKDTYTFGSFYGGHPNPTRANPNGAGLYTAPAAVGTSGAVFRTQIYDPDGSTPGSTTNASIALPANWPPVSAANSVEGDWRGPGVTNPDGPDDNPITIWQTNTNGIDEYTASNFGGALKGDLFAGHSSGNMHRVQLETDGTLQQFTPNYFTNIGGNALGITCNSDSDNFPGTIWSGTLNGKIVVFEPNDVPDATFPLRINAGGSTVTHNGDMFDANTYFANGTSFENTSALVPPLYQTEHTNSQPMFDYQIPAPNGDYVVVLHFAEIFWGATGGGVGGVGNRIFDVNIEGALVMDDYDIFADVGAETPVTKAFNVTVNDGQLDLNFSALAATGGVNQAKVSAIEVLIDNNMPPVAIASASPTNGDIPLNVNFTGDNSTDDVGVVSYSWDFKDGSPVSNLANPVHTFNTSGTYQVELMVEDEAGLTDTAIISITATSPGNESPIAVVSAEPIIGTIPLEVSFTGDNSTDDVAIADYLWDFNDGSSSSTEANPTHTFSATGIYDVTLTVEDAEGLTDSATITITANAPDNQAPVAVISATPENGTAPLEVNFTGSNSTDDTEVVNYDWNFDDGTANSSDVSPSHVFANAGTYDVTLTVEDGEGLSDAASIIIMVINEGSSGKIESMILTNPAKEVANVRLIDASNNDVKVLRVYIHDATGRLVAEYSPKDVVANGLYKIPIANLSNGGLYFVGFKMNNGERIVMNLIINN